MALCILLPLSLFLMVSCTEDATMESMQEVSLKEKQTRSPDDSGDAKAIAPGDDDIFTYTCYRGGLTLDQDCDGRSDLGWPHRAVTREECECITSNKVWEANLNGWCYDFPTPCQPSQCTKPPHDCLNY